MTYNEAIDYINATSWVGKAPGLERIRELLEKLDNPQTGMRFVHVAGTNGKGSVSAMIASILGAAGYKTGLFTSPYLQSFNERIRVGGRSIGDEELAATVGLVKPQAEAMADHPSEFEMTTAAALLYFRATGCQFVVLETGLGGRFDATNIIESPVCSVITRIGLDHTEILGGSLAEIAAEKAGIIKEGCPCVLYRQGDEVTDVVMNACLEKNSPLKITDDEDIRVGFSSIDGQSFSYGGRDFALSLAGENQLKNAACAIEAALIMRAAGYGIDDEAIVSGLYATEWPARFELVEDEPSFIVDGGHNPQGIESVRDNLLRYFPTGRRVILLGFLRDKDWKAMADILAAVGDEFVAVAPDSPRAVSARELGDYLISLGKSVTVCHTVDDGVRLCLGMESDAVVCACGSIYLAGEVRSCFGLRGDRI